LAIRDETALELPEPQRRLSAMKDSLENPLRRRGGGVERRGGFAPAFKIP